MTLARGPLALIIMDGVGLNADTRGNAVAAANTPVLDSLFANRPWSQLLACGEAVGLMAGQMGDSNVGHLNLGAGRVVYQDMLRILREVESGKIFKNEVLQNIMDQVATAGTALHLMGLVSHGGVHSHSQHLFALIKMAKERGVGRVYIHAFTDGRDVPLDSGLGYIEELAQVASGYENVKIASVSGRYYAMDRDKRWDRTQMAYNAIVHGQGRQATSGMQAVQAAYAREETDEFIIPTVITDGDGQPIGPVHNGDGVLFFNFRADRARQMTSAFINEDFSGFARAIGKLKVYFTSLTRYDASFDVPYAYPPLDLANTFSKVIADQGWRQLHIAETEKWAHVTYFFNGGRQEPYPGEDQVLIPSPKVATYDLQPEMSALAVTERVLAEIARDYYEVIILNFANGDMVGHTGNMAATIKAIETVDTCIGKILSALVEKGGQALITADHGNSDQMVEYTTGGPHTFHSLHPVPCILVSDALNHVKLRNGVLGDVAPTLLEMLGLPQPSEMSGQSLIIYESDR